MDNIKDAMRLAVSESKIGKANDYKAGGPFGAVIIKGEKIIATAHNTVLESHDATAHAEMNVIRKASKVLNTSDLSGCKLVVNAEPCPMCLSAIIWANIDEVYYANTKKDAAEIGFRDDMIYEYMRGEHQDILKKHHIESKEAKEVFDNFMEIENKHMY